MAHGRARRLHHSDEFQPAGDLGPSPASTPAVDDEAEEEASGESRGGSRRLLTDAAEPSSPLPAHSTAETEVSRTLSKLLSTKAGVVKVKHIRRLTIISWELHAVPGFYAYLVAPAGLLRRARGELTARPARAQSQHPMATSPLVSYKGLCVIHKVLREGAPEFLEETQEHVRLAQRSPRPRLHSFADPSASAKIGMLRAVVDTWNPAVVSAERIANARDRQACAPACAALRCLLCTC